MLTSLIPLPYRILVLVLLSIALYGAGYVHGAGNEQAKQELVDAQRAKQDAQHHDADTQQARKQEQKLRDLFDAAATLRQQEKAKHETDMEKLRAAARAGTERLRCPASLPAGAAPGDQHLAGGPGSEARPGDLVPQAADDLFGIASSIADVVRERNALIDAYNAARETCNASPPTQPGPTP